MRHGTPYHGVTRHAMHEELKSIANNRKRRTIHELELIETSVSVDGCCITQILFKFRMFVKILFVLHLVCVCQANFRFDNTSMELHWPSVDCVTDLLCSHRNENYKFYHIYVNKLLATDIGDKILSRVSSCLNAGILTTQ